MREIGRRRKGKQVNIIMIHIYIYINKYVYLSTYVPQNDDVARHDNGGGNLHLLALVPKDSGNFRDLWEGGQQPRQKKEYETL